jgi:hypothetical protein
MKIETAKAIVEAANVIGLEVQLREDYSGRGMYGSTTAGVIGDPGDITACAAYAAFVQGEEGKDVENEEMVEDLRSMRSDSMGRDMIYY